MHKKRKGDGYGRLRWKVFWQTLLMLFTAFAGIWFLYTNVLFGRFANMMVAVIQFLTHMSYDEALFLYRDIFPRHFSYFMLAGGLILFVLFFRLFLNWFTRYFGEIDRGVDILVERGEEEIKLSREMEPMEKKLNQVRLTLEQQFYDIREAEEKKDELVMYLAHDIRTPLTSVIGYLSLLKEMPDLTEEQRQKFVDVTLKKAERLETLVNEFFDITRFGRRETELSKEKIDLVYMLVQLREEAYPQLSQKNMTLVFHVGEECSVYGNPDKLARVFHNLLKNAIAYGDRESEIRITAEETMEETCLYVSNQGPVISKEEQKRLFDKFYRMDEARGSDRGGAGLGLAIAKELIGMHGGQITVSSADGYTTFKIVLPKK